ncbi:MAG: fructosamine kinase family protein [Pseudonocardiaceae bacterium]
MTPRPVLGVPVRDASQLGGGAVWVQLADERTVVVKTGQPSAVAAETAGLRWIQVPDGPPVPALLATERDHLVMEFVPTGPPTEAAAAALGRGLAALHAAGAPAFGAAPPGGQPDAWIGRAAMRNVEAPDWPTWYATDRVLPYLRQAYDTGDVTGEDAAVVEQVCDRLPELAGPTEPVARLHGDLWSGNVLWSGDEAWIIDPAAHGGHRETDLAMLALFGCSHLDVLRSAYTDATPLADSWRERVPLHQLFPLLVHVVLFGRGYAARAVAAAHATLRVG